MEHKISVHMWWLWWFGYVHVFVSKPARLRRRDIFNFTWKFVFNKNNSHHRDIQIQDGEIFHFDFESGWYFLQFQLKFILWNEIIFIRVGYTLTISMNLYIRHKDYTGSRSDSDSDEVQVQNTFLPLLNKGKVICELSDSSCSTLKHFPELHPILFIVT